jgi:hypothetical protein
MDVIEAQAGASTASVKAYWSLAPQWCYGSILVRQPSRGSGAFLDEAIRAIKMTRCRRRGRVSRLIAGSVTAVTTRRLDAGEVVEVEIDDLLLGPAR